MNRRRAGCVLVLSLVAAAAATSEAPRRAIGIQLLPGYSMKEETLVDALAWEIAAPKGPTISFEAGLNEGSWADPEKEGTYSWYREQVVNGRKVRLALIKAGLKTVWEPNDGRERPPGNILLVTFQLERSNWTHTANFAAKIASQEELADVLLMVLTFDPSTGVY